MVTALFDLEHAWRDVTSVLDPSDSSVVDQILTSSQKQVFVNAAHG